MRERRFSWQLTRHIYNSQLYLHHTDRTLHTEIHRVADGSLIMCAAEICGLSPSHPLANSDPLRQKENCRHVRSADFNYGRPPAIAGRRPLCFTAVVSIFFFRRLISDVALTIVRHLGGPSLPRNVAAQKHQISARFRTTSRLHREYLRNATRYRQSEDGVANYTDTLAQANLIQCSLVHKRRKKDQSSNQCIGHNSQGRR